MCLIQPFLLLARTCPEVHSCLRGVQRYCTHGSRHSSHCSPCIPIGTHPHRIFHLRSRLWELACNGCWYTGGPRCSILTHRYHGIHIDDPQYMCLIQPFLLLARTCPEVHSCLRGVQRYCTHGFRHSSHCSPCIPIGTHPHIIFPLQPRLWEPACIGCWCTTCPYCSTLIQTNCGIPIDDPQYKWQIQPLVLWAHTFQEVRSCLRGVQRYCTRGSRHSSHCSPCIPTGTHPHRIFPLRPRLLGLSGTRCWCTGSPCCNNLIPSQNGIHAGYLQHKSLLRLFSPPAVGTCPATHLCRRVHQECSICVLHCSSQSSWCIPIGIHQCKIYHCHQLLLMEWQIHWGNCSLRLELSGQFFEPSYNYFNVSGKLFIL